MSWTTTRALPFALLLIAPLAARAQGPVLVASSPLPALPWVPASNGILLMFDQALDMTTTARVQVRSEQYGGRRLVQTTASAGGTTLALQPLVPAGGTGGAAFRPGETMTVQVPTGVRGISGQPARPFQYQFVVETTGGSGNLVVPTLAPSPPLPSNGTAYHMVFGDVNNDGRPDIVAAGEDGASGAGTLYVLLNGGGAFNQPVRTTGVSPSPLGVALGDLDGDGDLDAVTSSAGPNATAMSVRLNDGSGTFSPPPGATAGQVPLLGYCRGIVLADIDGDGDLDALAGHSSLNTLTIRLNDGTAHFTTPPTGRDEIAVGSGPYRLALADLDNDGDLDLVAGAYFNNAVSVRLNDGTGLFTPAPNTPEVPVGRGPWTVALGDLNNDGVVDLVSCNDTGNSISVRLNDGTGRFRAPLVNPDPAVPGNPQSFALGDMDADGDLDLTVCTLNGSRSAQVLFNDGTGNLAFNPTVPGIGLTALPYHTALADIDGDGDLDLGTCGLSSPTLNVRLHQPATLLRARFSPDLGTVGTKVILSGPGYGAATAVRFNGVLALAPLRAFGPDRVLAVVPAGATTGLVTVTLPGGTASNPAQPFVVNAGGGLGTAAPAVAGLLLYPNPAHGSLAVQAAPSAAAHATLTLTNALGQRVCSHEISLPASGLRYELNLAGVAPGLYALRVQAGGADTTRRVVVE